jgi:multicomponent Na+:H+ antiporter subunit E
LREISLGGFLFAFWLALSGHYTTWLVSAGAVSAAVCVYAAVRAQIIDREGQPFELLPRTLIYYPWLIAEIIKSAWTVTKVILRPGLPVSPTMTVVHARQNHPSGIATFGNSITLTPGTITVGVSGKELTVHALLEDGARDLEAGDMNDRVAQFEGAR